MGTVAQVHLGSDRYNGVRVCVTVSEDKTPKPGGEMDEQTTYPDKPAINSVHRPPRPKDCTGNNPNVYTIPDPTYKTPVYPGQYENSLPMTTLEKPGYGDLGVRSINAGGSSLSLNKSYESSQTGTEDQFPGPNTSV